MPWLQEILDSIAAALAELRASPALRRLLHLLRFAGNRLNLQGSLDCSALHAPAALDAVRGRAAVALKLNGKLLQVLDTKTYHAGGSKLSHFLVAMCVFPGSWP